MTSPLAKQRSRWRFDDAVMFFCAGALVLALSGLGVMLSLLLQQAKPQWWPMPIYEWTHAATNTAVLGLPIYRDDSALLVDQGALEPAETRLIRLERQGRDVIRSKPESAILVQHKIEGRILGHYKSLDVDTLELATRHGESYRYALSDVDYWYLPNQLSSFEQWSIASKNVLRFLTQGLEPNSEAGGVYPAVVGTVVMVFLMTVFVMPLGVLAAVYLHEYAGDGYLTRLIRTGVHNLAAIPSVIYGVFGLGLFVYGVGGELDRLFFNDSLPAPTFGEPGLLWASLTLALLTLPVVIVATEEGMSRIPRSIVEASYALGATRAETLIRLVLPLTAPAMMTGLILAIARAAGEVAPLMLVGVVEYAPTLPLKSEFPFLALDQKFMHLGHQIYDLGFQSLDSSLVQARVYATAVVLFAIVVALNALAVALRNRLNRRYQNLLR
ncbi:Phosphate transport system permease protein PstA (TC 3.A.1.7.1) [Aequoribacter fuscus]|uniref:Phosphate transport system permease protein PstA n=1 Tax=Aequoribacter fuscus TaxID=2518989 RepID=F3L4T3_9GAMM|nr:phosphate ABC transporter permease PstA [Aequoribacter fuscus]EGG28667.1 Phosphate transport system permease protein PstA (TC 3.A.1.7.1) [Aequoribacter fuscus]QHJ88124.1 phosphate ABC transporter permease PstA [Aequoribacter fuscus]